jgi:outer membrane cobalamin receptor
MIQLLRVLTILLLFMASAIAQTGGAIKGSQQVTLRGRVTDAQTGEPMAKVKVIVIGSEHRAATDERGAFVIQGLTEGEVELYITTVGYGLVKKRVTLKAGEETNLPIALNQESAPLLSTVTVTAGAFTEAETNLASAHSLNKPELRALSTVLVADPVRAAQGLPGIVGNDDFRSEFSLRGAGFRRVGFFIDGLLLPENPTHTIFGDDDAGQISILNADTVASVTLLSGAYPSKYGDNTAGLLQFETREGNRVKPAGRVAASLLSTSAVFDGPLANKRGAWLVTARKSYLQYLLGQLNDEEEDEPFAIDFTDAQAKAVYNLFSRHQIGLTAILGRSDFDLSDARRSLGPNDLRTSKSLISLLYAHWDYNAGPRLSAQTRFFGMYGEFINQNPDELTLLKGESYQWGIRSDLNFLAHPAHRIEGGVYLRSVLGAGSERSYAPPPFRLLADFDRRARQQGYYLQDTWSNQRFRLALTGGVRIDHTSLTDETVVTPRAALSFAPLEHTRIRLGWGQYTEFPNCGELFGSRGNPRLRAERSMHYNASIEHLIGDKTRIVAEVYDREEKNLLFSLNNPLIQNGQLAFISFPFQNSLGGYARGFELSLHRRSANRLAGWLSYSYLKTRFTDSVTGFSFAGDFDQRHTVSAYGGYRLTNTINLSAQWRYGSGLPMVGFFREENGQVVLGGEPNRVRLPAYSRLDLRINKAFYFKRSKLTLSGEVLNVLARDNFRQDGRRREKLLPFLPSVGIAFEF